MLPVTVRESGTYASISKVVISASSALLIFCTPAPHTSSMTENCYGKMTLEDELWLGPNMSFILL